MKFKVTFQPRIFTDKKLNDNKADGKKFAVIVDLADRPTQMGVNDAIDRARKIAEKGLRNPRYVILYNYDRVQVYCPKCKKPHRKVDSNHTECPTPNCAASQMKAIYAILSGGPVPKQVLSV